MIKTSRENENFTPASPCFPAKPVKNPGLSLKLTSNNFQQNQYWLKPSWEECGGTAVLSVYCLLQSSINTENFQPEECMELGTEVWLLLLEEDVEDGEVKFGDECLRLLSSAQSVFPSLTSLPAALSPWPTVVCTPGRWQMSSHLIFSAMLPRGVGERLYPPSPRLSLGTWACRVMLAWTGSCSFWTTQQATHSHIAWTLPSRCAPESRSHLVSSDLGEL